MIPVTPLRPFTRLLMTIGEIPTSYLISMTYEEQLLWFCNYLEKTVIPAINNNAEAVKEVQELYEELKSYVDNYFDNLDVQEEIDNKLDEMAEGGQLADIIAQYLGLAGVLAYDTISDMASAVNIDEGSICRTLGQSTYNDGKGAFYKVRTITSGDTIDGVNIVALSASNTLIAERMPDYRINQLESRMDELESKKHLVIIGDSFSTTTYNPVETAWYTIVGKRLNLTVHNYAKDSAGYVHQGSGNNTFSTEVDLAIADTSYNNDDVDMVIVYGGLNDMNTTDIDSLSQACRNLCIKLINNFNNAKIIIAGINTWPAGPWVNVSNNLTALNYFYNMRSACYNLGVIFINSIYWLFPNQDLYASNNHPNVNGNGCEATNFLNVLYGSPLITNGVVEVETTTFTNGTGALRFRVNGNTLNIRGNVTLSSTSASCTIPYRFFGGGYGRGGLVGVSGVNKVGFISVSGQTLTIYGESGLTYYFDCTINLV